MLLVSTTNPFPAHRPWSAGSMSRPDVLVGSVALSTAFRPFTPTEPPSDMLMRSQPGPSGSQLTVGAGTTGSAPALKLALIRAIRAVAPERMAAGDHVACVSDLAAAASAFAVAACDEADRPAVDGAGNGPESREQPADAQPVAAGPTKVGAAVPRLDDVTALVVLATRAAEAPPETATASAIGSDNSDTRARDLRTSLDI